MSKKAEAEFRALADNYDAWAERYPEGSMGRTANRAEANKYRDFAVRAKSWPEQEAPDE